jgi:7-cyano-7-deazaguanine synthase
MERRPAIVLLSGGLDSATCLAIARAEGFSPIRTLAFDYGQRHRHELAAAERLSRQFGAIEHRVITIDLRQFGGSALTADIEVPKDAFGVGGTEGRRDGATEGQRDRGAEGRGKSGVETSGEGIASSSISTYIHSSFSLSVPPPLSPSVAPSLPPITYVPARNTIFLSFALAWCEVLDCDDVFIGVNALDYSGYPDCRPQFVESFQQTARLGTRRTGFTIHAPLVHWTKAQIIRRGVELGVDYSMTHSCYDPVSRGPEVLACGHCDSCLLRKRGFVEAGVADPTRYA